MPCVITVLPAMWPSCQSSWAPCAVVHNTLSVWGSNFSPGASAYQKNYFK